MRLAIVLLSMLVGGCAGQQWIIKEIAPQPPTIFVTGADYTESAEKFGLDALIDRVASRLSDPEVEVTFTIEERGQPITLTNTLPNLFSFADSSQATVTLRMDVSLLEYDSKKIFRSKADALGEMFVWGLAAALLSDEKIGAIMADVTIATSDRVLLETTVMALSDAGLSPRKSIEQAIERATEDIIGRLLHY